MSRVVVPKLRVGGSVCCFGYLSQGKLDNAQPAKKSALVFFINGDSGAALYVWLFKQ